MVWVAGCSSFETVDSAQPQALTALSTPEVESALATGYTDAEGHLGWTPVAQVVTDSGQAAITVPITVPPGRSGAQPHLALSYNSAGGGGPMGVGWQLSGLGAITRCGRDVGRDGLRNDRVFAADDDKEEFPVTLCLDGERLIPNDCSMSGACDPSDPFSMADYRLESSGSVVVFRDGEFGKLDTTFTVRSRDGGVRRYGGRGAVIRAELFENVPLNMDDPDGPSYAAPPSTRPERAWGSDRAVTYAWLLRETEDIAGNTVEFEYEEHRQNHAVEVLPSAVFYSGHARRGRGDREVKFDYEPLPRPATAFDSGFPLGSFHRLRAITTFAPAVSGYVRSYELMYGESESTGRQLLRQLQECSHGDRCREPVVFDYSSRKFGIEQVEELPEIANDAWAILDSNGDGIHELLSGSSLYDWRMDEDGSSRWHQGHVAGIRFPMSAFDHDGDGRDELLMGTEGYISAIIPTSSDSFETRSVARVHGTRGRCGASHATLYTGNLQANQAGLETWCQRAGQIVHDDDGDGVDELASAGELESNLPDVPTVSVVRFAPGTRNSMRFEMTQIHGDFNNDGLSDVLGLVNPLEPLVWTNTGNGYLMPVTMPVDIAACDGPSTTCEALWETQQAWSSDIEHEFSDRRFAHRAEDTRVADVNGDGLPDMFVMLAHSYVQGYCAELGFCDSGRLGYPWVFLNAGDHFVPVFVGPNGWDGDPRLYPMTAEIEGAHTFMHGAFTHAVMDANGDGNLDLLVADSYDHLGELLLTSSDAADRVVGIRAGASTLGGFEYGPLPSVHTPAEACGEGVRCDRYGTVVVSHSTGVGDSFDHRYAGLRFDEARQEGLGFEAHRVTNQETLAYTEQHFGVEHVASSGRHDRAAGSRFFLSVRGSAEDGFELSGRHTDYAELVLAEHQPVPTFVSNVSHIEDRTYESLDWPGCPFPCAEEQFLELIKRAELLSANDQSFGYDALGSVDALEQSVPGLSTQNTTINLQNIISRPRDRFVLGLPRRVSQTSQVNTLRGIERDTVVDENRYDSRGQLLETRAYEDEGARFTMRTYIFRNDIGQVTHSWVNSRDGRPWRAIRTAYDDNGFVRTVTDYLGRTTDVVIHPATGAAVLSRDANGRISRGTFDGFGRQVYASAPDGRETNVEFLPSGGLVQVVTESTGSPKRIEEIDAHGRVQHQQMDLRDHRVERWFGWDGDTAETRTETDPEGRSDRREDWVTTRVRRDTRERVTSVSRQEHGNFHNVQRLSYLGRQVYWTDNEDGALAGPGEGAEHTITRNQAGQVTRSEVKSAEGTETISYQYGTFGRLTHTVEGGQTWIREYDPRGRLLALTDPDAGLRRFAYDNLGQLIQEQYASGEPYRIAHYDLLGRPTLIEERDEPGEPLQDTLFEWDPANNLGALASAYRAQDDVSREFVYDSLGRMTENHLKVAGRSFDFEFAYNNIGQLTRTLYPRSPAFSSGTDARLTVENTYEDGLLTQVNNADTGDLFWAADRYSSSGSVLDEHFGNGVSTVRHLDPVVGRISQMTTRSLFADLSDVSLDWTEDARLAARTEMVPADGAAPLTEEFGYDGLGRLTDWHSNGHETGAFQYDGHGNLESLLYKAFDGSGATVESWGNALSFSGQQVASVNGLEAEHDALGRWISLGGANDMDQGGSGWQVSFNRFDLPTKVTRDGKSTSYGYDAFGSRVYSENDGNERISFGGLFDWSRQGTEETFTFRIAGAGGIVAELEDTAGAVERTYIHHDHLGNRTMETDSIGDAIARHHYTPFGERIGSDGRRLGAGAPSLQSGFGGHRHETSGFVDMRGRQYDPTIGRFLSVDPLNVQPLNPQSYNGYAYVLNDPLSLTDPSGYGPCYPGEGYCGGVDGVPVSTSGVSIGIGTPSTPTRRAGNDSNRRGYKLKPRPKRSRIADVQMSRAPRASAPVQGMSLNMVNSPVFGESYSVGSIDVGFVLPTAESTAWGDFWSVAQPIAEVGGSFVPVVGELMDLSVVFDGDEPWWARTLSGGSLLVNVATAGFAPNFGAFYRAASHADEVAELGVRFAGGFTGEVGAAWASAWRGSDVFTTFTTRNATNHIRRHFRHIRQSMADLGHAAVSTPSTANMVRLQNFIHDFVDQGITVAGKYKGADALWTQNGNHIVLRHLSGEFWSFFERGSGQALNFPGGML